MHIREKIINRLDSIFDGTFDITYVDSIIESIESTKSKVIPRNEKWSEKDTILITYGDSIQDENQAPLEILLVFLKEYLEDTVSFVHILPFFPYSSDDGFSVIDYKQVDPGLGAWSDIKSISKDYKLMFDLVINHISQFSLWFENYKKGVSPGKDYFIEAERNDDLSLVVRPRSLPLLTPVETKEGKKYVWTTFSADQIDLNFKSVDLLAEMLRIFLYYMEMGASMIRLDAIAFLWKEVGTNCLHLPQTHEFVKLLRDISDYINPGFVLLTETNVPNKENLSYFGNNDEANMVYQFSLPPLLLYTLFSENSAYLNEWAEKIPELKNEQTFFNFTASHDGIGVRPLEGLLPGNELERLVGGMKQFGGKISTKRNSDGSDSPYEINISYLDAMKGTRKGFDEWQESRFICSQTIMMAMKGIPAFYIHSLVGTHNFTSGVEETGMNRTINRKKWNKKELFSLLNTNTSHNRIFNKLKTLINIRKNISEFHPLQKQTIIRINDKLFAFYRGGQQLLCVSNISSANQSINLSDHFNAAFTIMDLISGEAYSGKMKVIELKPYQTLWLTKKNNPQNIH